MKYNLNRNAIREINKAKNSHELKAALRKHLPDAFIDWGVAVCSIGDRLKRIVDKRTNYYLVVQTADDKVGLLNTKTNTLWKNFSETSLMRFGLVSAQAFVEVTNGMTIDKFVKSRKRKSKR